MAELPPLKPGPASAGAVNGGGARRSAEPEPKLLEPMIRERGGKTPMIAKLSKFLLAGILTCIGTAEAGAASGSGNLVVYIECRSNADPSSVRMGSGVVISDAGHVLTARHVAPAGYSCRGALGNKTNPMRGLIRTHHNLNINPGIDGLVLRFVANEGETFAFSKYCRVTPALVGERLVAKGFHEHSVAEPAVTSGVLSTYIPSELGILETDVMTVAGKSGGPVFLDGTDNIVGIVAGAQFDSLGLPVFYGILVAEALSVPLVSILQEAQDCGAGGGGPSPPGTAEPNGASTTISPLSSKSAHYWAYPASSQWSSALVTFYGYRVGVSHTEDLPPAGESLSVFSFDIGQFAGESVLRAELDFTPTDVIGDPYGTLGVLKIEQISIGDLSQVIAAPAMVHSLYLTDPPQGPVDVTHAVKASLERGSRNVQFRVRFSSASLSNIGEALAAPDAFLQWDYGPDLIVHVVE